MIPLLHYVQLVHCIPFKLPAPFMSLKKFEFSLYIFLIRFIFSYFVLSVGIMNGDNFYLIIVCM